LLTWWRTNKSWAKMILPEAATTKALDEEKAFANVKAEIEEVLTVAKSAPGSWRRRTDSSATRRWWTASRSPWHR
jgi:hypothetical protein